MERQLGLTLGRVQTLQLNYRSPTKTSGSNNYEVIKYSLLLHGVINHFSSDRR